MLQDRPIDGRTRLFGQPLTIEAEILLCCAHVREDSKRITRCQQLLQEDVNWEQLLALAIRHSLTPLLYWQLRHFDDHGVPAAYLNELRDRFNNNAARNLLLAQELLSITGLLKSSGISSMPYKGPALAVLAYGNLSLRRFGDLDIIIPKTEFARAKSILIAEGYVQHAVLTEAQQAAVLRTHHSLAFLNESKKIVIELHWDVAGKRFSAQYDADAVGRRLITIELRGGTVDSLSAEDTLLALCVHGSKHLWERLAWVCDVAELITSHDEIDWADVIRQARTSGSWRMLALGLLLAMEMFDAPLPAAVQQAVREETVIRQLATQIAGGFFTEQSSHYTLLDNVFFNLRIRERLRDRVSYCGFIFTPTDADLASVSLPVTLRSLYYVLRPLRLGHKALRGSTADKTEEREGHSK
jgi:hypothetical protein